MKHVAFFSPLLAALVICVGSSACNRKPPAPEPSSGTGAGIRLGSSVFHFDASKARSLAIEKNDPLSGDHWSARVVCEGDRWEIASDSENAALSDRLANQTLILHLLDTLSTLHPVELATAAAESDGVLRAELANDGLDPPRYGLRWEAPDESGQLTSFEVRIGAPIGVDAGIDNSSNRLAYGIFPPDQAIYRIDGASLPMLDYIKTFSVLRQQVLSPLTSDDVEEIVVRGPRDFYAQRDGAIWADRRHRPWKKDVQGFLDRITHLRIEKFIDDPKEAGALHSSLAHHLLATITLKDRFSKPTLFRFARVGQRELAEVSTRPGAVFELYPSALSRLSP